jgi:hypothetical protein
LARRKGTPAENRRRDQQIKARLAALGGTVLMGTPAEFGKLMSPKPRSRAKVIKFTNIKAE